MPLLKDSRLKLQIFIILIALSGCKFQKENQFSNIILPTSIEEDKVDLVIEGKISLEKVQLDQDTIVQFPSTSFTSYDPWDGIEHTYTGVSLINLLDYLNMDPSVESINVTAKNDYSSAIRIQDLRRYEYIIAYKIDDVPLGSEQSLTKMGKFIIAINFSKHPDINKEIYKNQLVWQVSKISVE